jgi:sulfate transport system ATP-binding protein
MSFVGPVNELGETWIRPHDIDILEEPTEGAQEAQIERVTHLGFEVRVEFTLADRRPLWVQITREQAERLELEAGQIVWVRPGRGVRFPAPPASESDNGTPAQAPLPAAVAPEA